jgi:nitrite reductase/ring-hydroxylating ferredoxin subunit/uncharacterized membrane protein
MAGADVVGLIEKLDWIEPLADDLANGVEKSLLVTGAAAQPLRNFLHGTWLGHPLHPALTDIPVGAWTVSGILDIADLFGAENVAAGADAAVTIGLAGAFGAAVTGLTDWHVLEKGSKPRKVGTVHALLNITAIVLYAGSLVLRKTKKRGIARVLAALGYGLAGSSAYLGGILVSEQTIGVNHAPQEGLPAKWLPVLKDADLAEDELVLAKAGEVDLVLYKQDGVVFALANACSHLGGPLCDGAVEDGGVVCPWHHSRFDLATGAVLDGPATIQQPSLKTRVNAGQVDVKLAEY